MVRESHKNQCRDQLKRLGMALQEYHEQHEHFPAAAITDKSGKPLLSWRVAILPQLGYRSLHDRFHLDEPWDNPHNRARGRDALGLRLPGLADRRGFVTGYQVVVGPKPEPTSVGTLFDWARGVEIREVLDGTSNTLMVVEADRAIPWTQPGDPSFHRDGPLPSFGSGHPGGFHALLGDGSTRFIRSTIFPQVLKNLLTRDGGEVIGGD